MSRPKKSGYVQWRVHTPRLLQEILGNNETQALRVPVAIFSRLLHRVADRARELNDEQLNKLMLQLTLYAQADPDDPKYDRKLLRKCGL